MKKFKHKPSGATLIFENDEYRLETDNSKIPHGFVKEEDLEEIINNRNYLYILERTIDKVKLITRKDLKVFQVGDRTVHGKILDFKTNRDGNIEVVFLNQTINLEDVNKQLFLTEDGVTIYENTPFHVIDKKLFKIIETKGGNFKNPKWDGCRYYSKENAMDWLTDNKPCLSLKDVKDLFFNDHEKIVIKKLKEKFKDIF